MSNSFDGESSFGSPSVLATKTASPRAPSVVEEPSKTSQEPTELRERRIFNALAGRRKRLEKRVLIRELRACGIEPSDQRLAPTIAAIEAHESPDLDFSDFCRLTKPSITLVERALSGEMVIPQFDKFRGSIESMFERVRQLKGGKVADYIPQLARVSADHWATSICTIDGQRIDLGDSHTDFCVQSTCKPLSYCIALEEQGEAKVHAHVGREPSGRGFNELALNYEGRPHNPMINAGAIMSCSLIQPHRPMSDRFDHVLEQWRRACGTKVGFNNSVYLSERDTADRNFALGYFMQENRAFPEGTKLHDTLEFYFMCCSIEVTAHSMSVLAGTLANGGVNPVTGELVFKPQTVRNCLSLMYSCGMYDFSGEFAFAVGLPAKSGVSGAVMVVVPNVLGMITWSPRLDGFGNSVRGLAMCRELVEKYNFHNYDNLTGLSEKEDPRVAEAEMQSDLIGPFLWAASQGDMAGLKRLATRMSRLDMCDYDRRTALHLAASEGHLDAVAYLLDQGVNVAPVDRWGGTPLDDALRHGHTDVAKLLDAHGARSAQATA